MSLSKALWQHQLFLVSAFQNAWIHGVLDAWRRCSGLGTTPQELDFVAGLVIKSFPLVHSALTTCLSPLGHSVSIASVFCHQTPKASFGPSNSTCELGDILLAYVHTPIGGRQGGTPFCSRQKHQPSNHIGCIAAKKSSLSFIPIGLISSMIVPHH